ncbi:MAG: sugar ABC transporter substrate-binding protein [Treponema sp.]|nr:sugar ABC transporter substrate-binding protein [Treponema sp.]
MKKIRFSSFQTGDVEKDWVEVQFPRFQKEKGIVTEHVFIAQADTIATIMTWTAAGTAPDAAMLSANYQNALAAQGLLVDLDRYIREKKPGYNIKRYFPRLLDVYKYKGVSYAFPSDYDLGLLWYNKDMFDSAGVAYPTENWTWNDYRNAAAKLTRGSGPEKVYGTELTHLNITVWQAGGDFFSSDGLTATINTPQVKKAYEFIYGLIRDGYAPVPGDGGGAFQEGHAAMHAGGHGPWYAHYSLADVDFKWDVAPMPRGDVKSTTGYGSSFGILSNSKNQDEAFEFLDWFLSDEQQYIRAKQFAWFPPTSTVLNYPGFNDVSVLSMNAAQKALVLRESEFSRAPIVVARQNEINQILSRENSLVWNGEKSIDEALRILQQEINPLLK